MNTILSFSPFELGFAIAAALVAATLLVLRLGLRVVREDEAGQLVRRYGIPLAQGRLIALEGEAGYQATLLPPGMHFPVWRWHYKVKSVPLTVVRPGEIATGCPPCCPAIRSRAAWSPATISRTRPPSSAMAASAAGNWPCSPPAPTASTRRCSR